MSKNSKNSFRTRDRTDARSAPTLDAAGATETSCARDESAPGGPRMRSGDLSETSSSIDGRCIVHGTHARRLPWMLGTRFIAHRPHAP